MSSLIRTAVTAAAGSLLTLSLVAGCGLRTLQDKAALLYGLVTSSCTRLLSAEQVSKRSS